MPIDLVTTPTGRGGGTTRLGRIRPYSAALVEMTRAIDALLIVFCLWLLVRWFNVPFNYSYALPAWIAALAFIVIGSLNQLYRSWRSDSIAVEVVRTWLCWAAAALVTGGIAFMISPFTELSRTITVWWFVLTPLALAGMRVGLRLTLRLGRTLGHNYRRTAIVGATQIGAQIADSIRGAPWMGLRYVGIFDDRDADGERLPDDMPEAPLGTISDLVRAAAEGDVDQVYIALPLRAEQRIRDLIDRLAEVPHVSILYVPDFFAFNLLHARWEQVGNLPVVNVVTTPFLGASAIAKRVEDVLLASLILVLIAVPMLLIALAIRLDSKGPIIFRQRRYGLNGQPFEIWKFRTMTVCEDGDDFVQARPGDARVTRLGHFLRSTSLDELPQFLNVLRGEMSIVGPRPHPVALDEQHRRLIPHYVFRQKIRPGITGLAQVSGFRGPTDTLEKMQKRIERDIEYLESWTLGLDLRIIWLTIWRGFRDKNAI